MIKQALILAAGSGSRLDRQGKPKSLVEVGGKPLIFHTIESLIKAGISKIFIVTGYERNTLIKEISTRFIPELDIHFIDNDDWERGIVSSALVAKEFLSEPFILAMGDHYFEQSLIDMMAKSDISTGTVNLLVDPRDVNSYPSSAVRVLYEGNLIMRTGEGLSDFNGIDTGLFAVSPDIFFKNIEESFLKAGKKDIWSAMELIAKAGKLTATVISFGDWNDIDFPADLVTAEMRIRAKKRYNAAVIPVLDDIKKADEIYDFVAGEPVTTKMILMRGFFNDPMSYELIPRECASSPLFMFTDETVNKLYARKLADDMKKMGYNINLIVMPDGENSKSLTNYSQLIEHVLSTGVDEQSVFISVGGGVVCNICGFIASTVYRGLNLIHIPTSLMAQCDAAISHKQAINGQSGKNMVGSYYSPRAVLVDVDTLKTLDERLIYDGLSEVIKHALCQEQEYVDYLMKYPGKIVDDIDFLEHVVKHNIRLKCEISRNDPKELAEGMVLQYGHTLGHPVEHLSGYSLYHGESVAIGMMVAARVSRIMGACTTDLVNLHDEIISKYKLPTKIPAGIKLRDIFETLKYNKRYLTEGTRMALLQDVGKPWAVNGKYVIPVTNDVLVEAVTKTMEEIL
ncbi:iron-containing alcohol dehydrogenase [Myxococcota bacterium]|nr:iron-containing alcohol dehydrogenase [Myxococcota bacterium]MBU1382753.1 iron-containing alcohol dehydrogenase [Myxococcota bacterium]MBU1495615.1 iron-containing alcohol dehydrogenase [Myxococcota bacterium]